MGLNKKFIGSSAMCSMVFQTKSNSNSLLRFRRQAFNLNNRVVTDLEILKRIAIVAVMNFNRRAPTI